MQNDLLHTMSELTPPSVPTCWSGPPGITLSPRQVERGMQLAKERGLDNVQLQVRARGTLRSGRPGAALPAAACVTAITLHLLLLCVILGALGCAQSPRPCVWQQRTTART